MKYFKQQHKKNFINKYQVKYKKRFFYDKNKYSYLKPLKFSSLLKMKINKKIKTTIKQRKQYYNKWSVKNVYDL